MKKVLNILSSVVLVYFIIVGAGFFAGKLSVLRDTHILFYPLDIMFQSVSEIKRKGVRAFQTDKVVEKVNSSVNKLDEALFVLHSNPQSSSIDLVNLRNGDKTSVIDISNDITLKDVNDRIMIALDTNNQLIYCNLHPGNTLYKFDYDGIKLDEYHFDFEIHHRSEVFNGRFFCNTRRTISMPGFTDEISDEGFAEIGLDGSVLNLFWFSDQKDQLDNFQSLISFTAWPEDPFHLNDVELVWNSKNISDTSKLMNEDVLISARHLNAIFVVRNNSIHRTITGSFNLQHDVDFINDSIVSISNNNSSGSYVNFIPTNSNVIHYNIVSNEEIVRYNNVGFSTQTEGQVQYLPSGRVILENQNKNEFIVLLNDTVIYRGGITYSLDSNYSEFLSWDQAFDSNPFKKPN